MQTKCPHCQTIFKVSDEHLKVADGYVRCGICKEVFNALEKVPQLNKKMPAANATKQQQVAKEKVSEPENAAPTSPVAKKEKTDTAIENQTAAASADKIASNETEEAPEADDNSAQADLFAQVVEAKADETASETIKPEKIEPKIVETNIVEDKPAEPVTASKEIKTETAVEKPKEKPKQVVSSEPPAQVAEAATEVSNSNLFDGVQSKLIPDEYRIPELHNTYSIWRDVTWTLAILILTASLFVEYAWFNRNELISNPQLRPLVTQICLIADCDAMNLREPNAIEMTTRNIYTHPNVDDALMISGTLINHAQFEQPYPSILIDFSDVRGEVIASRLFTPEDYLQIKVGSLKPLAPQASIDFNMEILDPGKQAMTYEFSFL